MLGNKLKKGDTLGIIAPASFTSIDKVESAKNNLEKMGFKVILGESTKSRWYSYAGPEELRVKDINDFFADSNIDGIICMRGGYGCNRLVEMVDYSVIKKNPKVFIGYSDITTLHMSIFQKTGLVTFHGPMAVSNFSGEYNQDTYKSFEEVLMNDNDEIVLKNFTKELGVLSEGRAEGGIVGGNLATMIASLGTEYDVDYNGKILFLEEIGEKTYKIDRMLNQLKKFKVFEKINGIILGDFRNCPTDSENDMCLMDVFKDYLSDLKMPVVYNFESGHSEPMITLPMGAKVRIDTAVKEIKILEKVVR
ncbi:LD-carboxypeptidase [uncultured Fusobacterium sp.]|uniref:S66 peptidase family protein n=1 Tax=uncultured Fusobacterium sp. TaxID=159267 RepID=UPI0025F69613|nr:LD-carboxypeptidase [uncultured Fusobacterium sp.]